MWRLLCAGVVWRVLDMACARCWCMLGVAYVGCGVCWVWRVLDVVCAACGCAGCGVCWVWCVRREGIVGGYLVLHGW